MRGIRGSRFDVRGYGSFTGQKVLKGQSFCSTHRKIGHNRKHIGFPPAREAIYVQFYVPTVSTMWYEVG